MKLIRYILSLLLKACAALPFSVLYVLSDITFVILFHIVRYRRKVVDKNISESFPEMSANEKRKVSGRFFRNFSDYIFETIKLLHISDRQIKSRMTFDNTDLIDRFLSEGRSVAVYFSHCFNWEWAPSVSLHTKARPDQTAVFAQVYRPLRDHWTDDIMLKIRGRFGSHSYPKSTVFRDLIRNRRATGLPAVVGFMSDQHPSHGDLIHVVDFLNHPTAVITGTETLARKLDMAVIYWDVEKPSRGHYRITCRLITDDIASLPDFSVTNEYARLLESTIRRDPALWLWSHKRWKHPVTFDDNEQPRH